MPFTSGTATDYHDLLDQLRTWLTGTVGWTELAWTAPGSLTDNAELNLRGPGAGVDKQVFINIRSENDPSNNAYGWKISGATSYVSTAVWGAQPFESPGPYINLWDSSIDFWFYGNDRHFKIVAKTSTTYTSCYCGFILPWATPPQFPFPLYIGGDYPELKAWNFANSARRFFVDPGGSFPSLCGAWARSPEGIWVPMLNNTFGGSTDAYTDNRNAASGFTLPYGPIWTSGGVGDDNFSGGDGSSGGGVYDLLLPTDQGERIIVPIQVCRQSAQPLGVLDGVYAPFGSGLTAEQAVAIGARDFMAFQNMNRNSGNDFMVIEEVA